MNLEPIPIGTPRPPKIEDAHPVPVKRTILDRVRWTWGRTFGFGVAVGVLAAIALALPFALARENEWQDRLKNQTGERQAPLPAVPRK